MSLVKWHVKPGEPLASGDPIVDLAMPADENVKDVFLGFPTSVSYVGGGKQAQLVFQLKAESQRRLVAVHHEPSHSIKAGEVLFTMDSKYKSYPGWILAFAWLGFMSIPADLFAFFTWLFTVRLW